MIAFSCACGRQFSVKQEFAGRSTRCPTCKETLVVPAAMAPTVDFHASDATAGRRADLTPPAPSTGSSAKTGDSRSGDSPSERYVMGAEIARGGMGAVLQATDREIRREVAVKFLLDQSDQTKKLRFIEEAQITGQLEHPNIVPIHELGVDAQQRLFFSMKMVRGRSLAQVLASLKKEPSAGAREYSLTRLLNFFLGICNALAYSHSRGVVHRDLKPANIMVGDFGEVYVMDWGLAKVLNKNETEAEQTRSLAQISHAQNLSETASVMNPTMADTIAKPGTSDRMAFRFEGEATALTEAPEKVVTSRESMSDLTREGSVMGTPVYMPPEQATGQIHAIDERSDIYSLGAILYEILTLQPPISRGGDYVQTLQRVVQGEIVPPAQLNPERARARLIPPELAAVAMKALALLPDKRYQSVEFLRRDIELFLDGRSVSAKDDSRAELIMKFVKRNTALSVATAAALAVVTVVVGWSLFVNLRARRDVENAYIAYETMQKEKEARTRLAVPALVKAAQLEADQLGTEEALKQINLALEYDPGSPQGRLLRGQLLIAKQDFKAAVPDLETYLTRRPKDLAVQELKRLCERVKKDDDDKSTIILLAQTLTAQNYPFLAERLLKQHSTGGEDVRQELLHLYQKRLELSWPRKDFDLTLDSLGFHLKVRGSEIRDLLPLKGMILSSIDTECDTLKSLKGVEGMPLQSFAARKSPLADLTPLAGSPLTSLRIENCFGLSDLSSLQGMPLKEIALSGCSSLQDLSVLKGMPLESLHLTQCGANDLSPLKGASLTTLTVVNSPGVRDLTPLAGMPLTALNLAGCNISQDLSPLERMPITQLDLSGCLTLRNVSALKGIPLRKLNLNGCSFLNDISGLQGMPIEWLHLDGCARLEDLTPLKGMSLNHIGLSGTAVHELGALRGMSLLSINLYNCKALTDLSGIQGMPLNQLNLDGCSSLSDLSALRGMVMNSLSLSQCPEIKDLTPLAGMPLNTLFLKGCSKVTNLAPLKDCFLNRIELVGTGISNLDGLQAMRFDKLDLTSCSQLTDLKGLKGGTVEVLLLAECGKLKQISGLEGVRLKSVKIQTCPELEDLSGLKGLPLKELVISGCPKVRDLSCVRDMPLEVLQATGCLDLVDLSPLKGLRLKQLIISSSSCKDLTPLRGMPLAFLRLDKCLELQDLSPLEGLKLEEVYLPPQVTRGLEVLRQMPSLVRIDGMEAQTFWRKQDTPSQ